MFVAEYKKKEYMGELRKDSTINKNDLKYKT